MNTVLEKIHCKFCNSTDIIRYGTHKNVQRYWCKNCQRKFADNHALPHMKVPVNQIGPAVGAYYEGESLLQISQDFVSKYGIYVSDSTVRRWIERFSLMAAHDTQIFHPDVSNKWIVNYSKVPINNTDYWLIDVIDWKTHFILSTTSSDTINSMDLCYAIDQAQRRASDIPKSIILIDKLRLFSKELLDYELYNIGIPTESYLPDDIRDYVKKIRSTYYKRNNILIKLKNIEYMKTLIDGWLVHYNFHRRHEYLDNYTPAEKAGINTQTEVRY